MLASNQNTASKHESMATLHTQKPRVSCAETCLNMLQYEKVITLVQEIHDQNITKYEIYFNFLFKPKWINAFWRIDFQLFRIYLWQRNNFRYFIMISLIFYTSISILWILITYYETLVYQLYATLLVIL